MTHSRSDLKDCLNHEALADAMVRMFDLADLPLNVLVYGDWGTGKSTYLDILSRRLPSPDLKTKNTYHVVRFNPWEYETSPNLLIPLLGAMEVSLSEETELWEKVSTIFEACFRAAADAGIRAVSHGLSAGAVKLKLADFEKSLGDAEKPRFNDTVSECKTKFRELVKAIRDHKNARAVVIMLDDMDRCTPDSVVSLIEGVKLYFGQEKETYVIFVWAMDRSIVERAITTKYAQEDFRGADYLEKIFDFQTPVPRLSEASVHALITEFCQSDRDAYIQLLGEHPEKMLTKHLNRVVTRNPRTIVRILTMLKVLAGQAEAVKTRLAKDKLVATLILAYRFRDWRFDVLHHKDQWKACIEALKSKPDSAETAQLMTFLNQWFEQGDQPVPIPLREGQLRELLDASESLLAFGF